MSAFSEEIIVCFESVSEAIMAEQFLAEEKISVRIMPTPAGIRGGCGFCLRFLPEDIERAAAFLLERGVSITEAFQREGADIPASYKKISIANGGENVAKH